MSLQEIADAVTSFVREHPAWALPIVFLLAFGESLCIFSIVFPATIMLAGIASVLAAGGTQFHELWPAMLVATLGGSLGYATSYWIGMAFKDNIHGIWPFRNHPRLIPRGERFFAKYGFAGVFFGHFFGPIRGVIPLAAGMFNMNQMQFQIANIISAAIWAIGVMAPFFFLVGFKDDVAAFVREHEMMVAAVMFAIAFINAVPNLLFAVPSLLLIFGLAGIHIFSGGSIVPLAIAAAAGAFLGDLVFYRWGAKGHADFTTHPMIDADPEDVSEVRAFLAKSGPLGIVTSKFLGMKRCLVPVISGVDGLPFTRFVPVSAVSSVLWAVVLLTPVYFAPAILDWVLSITGFSPAALVPASAPLAPATP